ncbi:MAG: hypothetical protein WB557_00290 [Solirubrobacteraceae bacterium]
MSEIQESALSDRTIADLLKQVSDQTVESLKEDVEWTKQRANDGRR